MSRPSSTGPSANKPCNKQPPPQPQHAPSPAAPPAAATISAAGPGSSAVPAAAAVISGPGGGGGAGPVSPQHHELTSLFECPVCFDYVLPPILQCQAGHLVCNQCRQKLSCCPTCRGALTPSIRNLAMEKVASAVLFPCKGRTCHIWKFPGWRSNQNCSCRPTPQPQQQPNCICDAAYGNPGSLTH